MFSYWKAQETLVANNAAQMLTEAIPLPSSKLGSPMNMQVQQQHVMHNIRSLTGQLRYITWSLVE